MPCHHGDLTWRKRCGTSAIRTPKPANRLRTPRALTRVPLAHRPGPAVRGSAHCDLAMNRAPRQAATGSPSPDTDRVHAAAREARNDAAPFALVAAAILIALALV